MIALQQRCLPRRGRHGRSADTIHRQRPGRKAYAAEGRIASRISPAAAIALSTSRESALACWVAWVRSPSTAATPAERSRRKVEPDVLHGEHAGLEMARHLSPAAPHVDDRLPLALEQLEPSGPLGVVGLFGQRRDSLVDLGQLLGVHAAVERVERAGQVGGALVQAVDGLLDLGEQLPLGGAAGGRAAGGWPAGRPAPAGWRRGGRRTLRLGRRYGAPSRAVPLTSVVSIASGAGGRVSTSRQL